MTGSAPSMQVAVVGQQAALDVGANTAGTGGRHSQRHVCGAESSTARTGDGDGLGLGDGLGDGEGEGLGEGDGLGEWGWAWRW